MLRLDRTQQFGLRVRSEHCGRPAGVIAVAMAQHDRIEPFAEGPQQGHEHSLAGIALRAVARPGVVEQAVRGRPHQHGIALPDVGRQKLKLAQGRARRLPEQGRQHQRKPQRTHRPRQAHGEQNAPRHAGNRHPQRGRRHRQGGEWQAGEPLQEHGQDLHAPRGDILQRMQDDAEHCQGRHNQRDPRDRDRIRQQADGGDLLEQQQCQRRQGTA